MVGSRYSKQAFGAVFGALTQLALLYCLLSTSASTRQLPHMLMVLGHPVIQFAIYFMAAWSHAVVIFSDPGRVAATSTALEPTAVESLAASFCSACEKGKPPGAHHCSVCNVCIEQMDHHCIFIGNCVGKRNQKLFILFLVYLLLACTTYTPH